MQLSLSPPGCGVAVHSVNFNVHDLLTEMKDATTILVKILGTSHKIALLQSLIQCPPLPPFQCWLNQKPFHHPNIELGGKGDEMVLNVCFHLDILGNMTIETAKNIADGAV